MATTLILPAAGGASAAPRAVAAVASRRPARPASGGVRLTRRGRLVVLLLSLAIVLGVGVALSGGSVATQEPGTAEPTQTLIVRSGQTLWDIAAARTDEGDVRGMVERIERLNALDSAEVTAGQRLVVPAN